MQLRCFYNYKCLPQNDIAYSKDLNGNWVQAVSIEMLKIIYISSIQ